MMYKWFVVKFIILCYLGSILVFGSPCKLRKYPNGLVCVCNETYCDYLDDLDLFDKESYVLVSSSRGGLRFNVQHGNSSKFDRTRIVIRNHLKKSNIIGKFGSTRQSDNILKSTLIIDRQKKYQKIKGFGSAFTGTVSYLLQSTSKSIRDHIFNSYYSKTIGIGHSFMRIPIGASDFDLEPWAYNEMPVNDENLSNFTKLDQRDIQRLVQIKELQEVTGNEDIKFIGAAWSCPTWMKTKSLWSGHEFLKENYYLTWANYHIKFLELMEKENITFWAISTGNEPFNAVIAWPFVLFVDLGWMPGDQGKWVGQYLGPLLRNSSVKHVKLLGMDDQRYQLPWWFKDMEKGFPNSTQYLDGIAVHWYRDRMTPSTFLDNAHEEYPDKFILNTESSIVGTPKLGSWDRAEQYIEGFFEDLSHWVNGWIDWNLIVDPIGGPNYARNFVDAPIILNTTDFKEFYKQPIFYAIGHFSRFLLPDSIRIDAVSDVDDILAIAVQNPNNSIAIIIYNKSNQIAEISIEEETTVRFQIVIPPKSIHSLIYF